MRTIWMGLVLMGTVLAGAAPDRAQDAPLPRLTHRFTSAEAFATPYGTGLIDRFVGNLEASLDRACLAERNMAAPSRERAAEWLMRYGQRVIASMRRTSRRACGPPCPPSSQPPAPARLRSSTLSCLIR